MEIYAYKHAGNAVKQLNLDIAMLQHGEKSRERAVLELALHLGLGIFEFRELKKEGLSEEEAISEFLKGEKLHLTEDDPEIEQIVAKGAYALYGTKKYEPSPNMHEIKEKPPAVWYLAPLFLGLIGGIWGCIAVKDEDIDMAVSLLMVGIIMTFVYTLVAFWAIFL